MNEGELLDVFLGDHPASFHPKDEERFVRWAISAQRLRKEFPVEKFREKMDEEAVEYYRDIYRWVDYFLQVLREES